MLCIMKRDRRGPDCMVVGSTYTNCLYDHYVVQLELACSVIQSYFELLIVYLPTDGDKSKMTDLYINDMRTKNKKK